MISLEITYYFTLLSGECIFISHAFIVMRFKLWIEANFLIIRFVPGSVTEFFKFLTLITLNENLPKFSNF